MKKKVIILLVVIVAAAAGGYAWLNQKNHKATDIIRVSGNIEVTDAEISFKIPGHVLERCVTEGETIKAGQIVARLDNRELTNQVAIQNAGLAEARSRLEELENGSRPEEIAQAEAAAAQAKAFLDELLAGSRPQEIAAAEATLNRAKADEERLTLEYRRQKDLFEKKVASEQSYDLARTSLEAAQAAVRESAERLKLIREGPRQEQIDQARAALQQSEESLALVRQGPRKEIIDQARARMEQARDALALAKTRLSDATLASPLSGIVLSKNIEPGEYVSPGTPIVTVGDLDNVWIRAYINETDLGRVKPGQSVRVTTDTYSDRIYEGTVSFISSEAEFTPKNVQTQEERVKLVYRIKIDIRNPNMELKPGMPADAEIRTEP